jgi:NADH-ubiquinone oxidoreductase chain 2
LPKWIVIQAIITNNITPLATVVVVTSLITLYYYLKIAYSRFIILNTEPKWNLKLHKNKQTKNISALILSTISLTGMAVCTIISNIN